MTVNLENNRIIDKKKSRTVKKISFESLFRKGVFTEVLDVMYLELYLIGITIHTSVTDLNLLLLLVFVSANNHTCKSFQATLKPNSFQFLSKNRAIVSIFHF